MRILHVVTLVEDQPAFTGPAGVAIKQCQELRRRGYDVEITGGWDGYPYPPQELDGIPAHLFQVHPVAPGLRFSLGFAQWLREHATSYDAAHVHLTRDLVPLVAGNILHRAGVPYMTQTHGMVMPDSRRSAKAIDIALTVPVLQRAQVRFALTNEEEADLANVLGAPGLTTRLPDEAEAPDLRVTPSRGIAVLPRPRRPEDAEAPRTTPHQTSEN